jgi:uncharacterized protein
MTNIPNSINYIEFPLKDKKATMAFYRGVFGWEFTEWGDSYISFSGAGVEGGFNGVDQVDVTAPGILVVLYSLNLEETQSLVQRAGGIIHRAIYPFPGGRRFHFKDPNGIELAVWSES